MPMTAQPADQRGEENTVQITNLVQIKRLHYSLLQIINIAFLPSVPLGMVYIVLCLWYLCEGVKDIIPMGRVTQKLPEKSHVSLIFCYPIITVVKVPLTPQIFFGIKKLLLLPCLLWRKSFWPWIFPSDVVPFQSKEVEHF